MSMKKRIGLVAVGWLLFVSSAGPDAAAGEAGVTRLRPEPAYSFATAAAGQIVVGIVGEGWAIRFVVDREKSPVGSGQLSIGQASFIRGPLLQQYIRPSAGPPTPALPKSPAYSVQPLAQITVTSVGWSGDPAAKGHLELAVSQFTVAGERFVVDGTVRLPLRGPLP